MRAQPITRVRHIALATGLLLAGMTAAQAQTAGSLMLGTGWMHIAPQVSTGPMNSTQRSPLGTRSFSDGAISAQVRSSDTLGLTATYFITDNIAAEMVGGIPPKFTITGAGTAEGYGAIGTARMWSPAILLKYYFGQANATFRPFVGVGASYIWFNQATIGNKSFENTRLHGPTKVSVNSGFSPVFNVGASYKITDNWYAGASISYIPMTRTITLDNPAVNDTNGQASVHSTQRARMNPVVTYFNITRRF